jgi:hypothetical protein
MKLSLASFPAPLREFSTLRRGGVAGCGTGAAAGDAGHRVPRFRFAGNGPHPGNGHWPAGLEYRDAKNRDSSG